MSFSAIEKLLVESIGLDTESIGKPFIKRTVISLLEHKGLRDIKSYFKLLKDSPKDMEQLIEKVIVPETWFFRDINPFIFLQQYVENNWIPHSLSCSATSNKGSIVRVLSVPCSTGEEPYSIAMTLLEAGLWPEQFHIDAVDISKQALEQAKRAIYDKRAFRGKGTNYQNRYFFRTTQGYKLNAQITELVHFHHDNLLHPTFLANSTPYHIIFCRNLLIYLTSDAQQRIFTNLDNILIPNGLLFTGHSELSHFNQYGYTPVKHPRSFACQKTLKTKQIPVGKRVKKVDLKPTPVHHAIQKTAKPQKNISNKTKKSPQKISESTLESVRTLADQGFLEEAYSLCEKLLKEHNTNTEVYYLMGLINHASNNIDIAEDYFLKSIYLDPNYYEALVQLSLLYDQKGNTAKSSLFKERAKRLYKTEKDSIQSTA